MLQVGVRGVATVGKAAADQPAVHRLPRHFLVGACVAMMPTAAAPEPRLAVDQEYGVEYGLEQEAQPAVLSCSTAAAAWTPAAASNPKHNVHSVQQAF